MFQHNDIELELENGIVVEKQLKHEEEENEVADITLVEMLKMNAPEWYLIIIGTLASVVTGFVQIVFAIVMSEIIGVSLPVFSVI